jgi:acyl carrier protein
MTKIHKFPIKSGKLTINTGGVLYFIEPEEIGDDIELFSDESGLELDSLDALQISMGLQDQFGIRLADTKDFRRVVTTINALAEYIQPE